VSYDLTLFRPLPGLDPIESYHRIMEEAPGLNAVQIARALMDQNPGLAFPQALGQAYGQIDYGDLSELPQLAERLKARVPEFRQSRTITGPPWIELDHHSQVQVLITNTEIGVTMPYFRPGLDAMMSVVGECLDTLAEVGFVAYDPQFGKIVTRQDFVGMKAAYRDTDRVLPKLRRDAAARRAPKPWWKFW
jgi:hypothetical protein